MNKISNKTVEKLKAKDHDAFAEIFFAYKETVYSFAKHNLKNVEDANDCVQEIFQKLFINSDKYHIPRNNFNAWFIQLTKNHIIDTLRKKQHEKDLFIIDNDYVLNCAGEEENRDLLISELQEYLGIEQFMLLTCRILHKISFRDIAYIFNINRETARLEYYKILQSAKQYVKGRDIDER